MISDLNLKNLTVYGRFLRRGGIDINPIRSMSRKIAFQNFRDSIQ
jgi:NADPH-dependent 7-cyano-7-deazaguanine reductase QueF